jgi:hypothetical protein
MKEAELRKHTTCSICNRKTLATGLPLFYRVTIERFGVDVRAMQRQDGLAQFLGSSRIASVMGTDEDMAAPIGEASVLTVCEDCSMDDKPVAHLADLGSPR